MRNVKRKKSISTGNSKTLAYFNFSHKETGGIVDGNLGDDEAFMALCLLDEVLTVTSNYSTYQVIL
jgi:hypothetical protein